MIFYRIEDDHGKGPFMNESTYDKMRAIDRVFHSNLPTSGEENLIPDFNKDWKHGCNSMDQLNMWFGNFKEALKDYFLTVYEADSFHIGNYQSIFTDAKLIKKLPYEGY